MDFENERRVLQQNVVDIKRIIDNPQAFMNNILSDDTLNMIN